MDGNPGMMRRRDEFHSPPLPLSVRDEKVQSGLATRNPRNGMTRTTNQMRLRGKRGLDGS